MSEVKKYHHWLKEISDWQREEEKPLSIRPRRLVKKPCCPASPPKRYYIEESHPIYSGIYLTQRELEISALLIRGQRYKTIAERLSLSPRSVEFYVQNIRLKFHSPNKKALIAILIKIELIQKFKL